MTGWLGGNGYDGRTGTAGTGGTALSKDPELVAFRSVTADGADWDLKTPLAWIGYSVTPRPSPTASASFHPSGPGNAA